MVKPEATTRVFFLFRWRHMHSDRSAIDNEYTQRSKRNNNNNTPDADQFIHMSLYVLRACVSGHMCAFIFIWVNVVVDFFFVLSLLISADGNSKHTPSLQVPTASPAPLLVFLLVFLAPHHQCFLLLSFAVVFSSAHICCMNIFFVFFTFQPRIGWFIYGRKKTFCHEQNSSFTFYYITCKRLSKFEKRNKLK